MFFDGLPLFFVCIRPCNLTSLLRSGILRSVFKPSNRASTTTPVSFRRSVYFAVTTDGLACSLTDPLKLTFPYCCITLAGTPCLSAPLPLSKSLPSCSMPLSRSSSTNAFCNRLRTHDRTTFAFDRLMPTVTCHQRPSLLRSWYNRF
jgi:hypothetical protein